MSRLMIALEHGTYARMSPAASGVALEFGEVAGGGFFPTTRVEVGVPGLWDGYGWNLRKVQAVVESMHPPEHARSQTLQQARRDIVRRMRRASDEGDIAGLIRLAEALQAADVLDTLKTLSRKPALSEGLRDLAYQARWQMAYSKAGLEAL